ncbi:hypothetical protein BN1708_020413, partial [Verticillium longisporum]
QARRVPGDAVRRLRPAARPAGRALSVQAQLPPAVPARRRRRGRLGVSAVRQGQRDDPGAAGDAGRDGGQARAVPGRARAERRPVRHRGGL